MRSRRLEGLLGGPLDQLTARNIRSLVDLHVPEAFDLDFKAQLYGPSDKEKRDLSGDVAAMANTAGGVIIIGIGEDKSARAAGAPGVDITDVEMSRIRQIVAAGVSPMPAFDLLQVVDGDSDPLAPHGFVLIAVPRSPLAPHAVLINGGMRFPVRNGATTRYLSEPEVATAYRERLLGAAQRAGQIEQIEASVIQRLNVTERPWLVVSLLPELPGDFTITSDTFAVFETEIRGRRINPIGGGPSFYHAAVGHQRLLADGNMSSTSDSVSGLAAELNTGGAGVLALQMWDIRRSVAPRVDGDETLSDEGLANGIIGALNLLAGHARDRAQASGMAQIRALVVPSDSEAYSELCPT